MTCKCLSLIIGIDLNGVYSKMQLFSDLIGYFPGIVKSFT